MCHRQDRQKNGKEEEARAKKEAGHRILWTTDELNHVEKIFKKFF